MTRKADKALQLTWSEDIPEGLRRSNYCCLMVLGVGGAGNNTVSQLMKSGVTEVECVAIDTSMPDLNTTRAGKKLLIGEKLTRGLGSGGAPDIGIAAVEESAEQVEKVLEGTDIAFVAAGMGGGTGTGAGPVIARMAREKGAIVVGVATLPIKMEKEKIGYALMGLTEMRRECHTVIIIDNNKLMQLVPQLSISEAFKVGNSVVANIIGGVAETISLPSLINLDFADFRTVIKRGGVAVGGVGQSDAPNRAEEAVKRALSMPLLDVDYTKAKGALIHVSGDEEMTIDEANRVGEVVTQMLGEDALVVWGARVSSNLAGKLKVTLVMTGVRSQYLLCGYGSITPEMHELDPIEEPEKPLNIDFGLYQL